MKIILEKEEVLNLVFLALCNGGLQELAHCSVQLKVTEKDYTEAKVELTKDDEEKSICLEDVYAQVLRGGKPLQFFDYEGEEAIEFSLEKAIEALSTEEAVGVVLTYKNEQDDAITATELLQHCLYGEVIFG